MSIQSLLIYPIFGCLLIISSPNIFAQPTILFEEDFDGGIPFDWDISPGNPIGATWHWTSNGKADSVWVDNETYSALFWNNRPAIDSESADNGAVFFNSDAYESGGTGIGQGPFPGEQRASLTTPAINCSFDEKVYLQFHQFARGNRNLPSTIVSISNDNGETWLDIPINQIATENGSTSVNDIELLDISEVAAGFPQVKIRFLWEGRYYFWIIDDVKVISPPQKELVLEQIDYPLSSFAQPAFQIPSDTLHFNAYITNLGTETLDSISFQVDLFQQQGAQQELIYMDSMIVHGLPGLCIDSMISLPQVFIPQLPEGEYRLVYRTKLLDGVDYIISNNELETNFRVTEDEFAKESDYDLGLRPLASGDYEIANVYQMGDFSLNNWTVDEVSFAVARDSIDGPLEGESVTINLYRVSELIFPDFSNFSFNTYDDLELIAYQNYTFLPGSLDFDIFSTQLIPLYNDEVILEPGQRYVLSIRYEGTANTIFHAFNDDIVYNDVSTILFFNNWFLGGFGYEQAAVLRMKLRTTSNTSESDDISITSGLSAYPNPATDLIKVKLPPLSSDSDLIITTSTGQLVKYWPLQKNGEEIEIPLDQLPSGAYVIKILSKTGIFAEPFIKH